MRIRDKFGTVLAVDCSVEDPGVVEYGHGSGEDPRVVEYGHCSG